MAEYKKTSESDEVSKAKSAKVEAEVKLEQAELAGEDTQTQKSEVIKAQQEVAVEQAVEEAKEKGKELSLEEIKRIKTENLQFNVTQAISQEQKDIVDPVVNLEPIKINPTKVPDTRDPRDPRDPRGSYEDPRESPLGLDDLVGPSGGEYGDPRSTDTPDPMGMSYEVSGNTSITQEDGVIKVNPSDNQFYNTISCPCSTYAIKDSSGNYGCEREYYGVKQYFKPARRTNHFIENNIPRLGDKWACRDKTCKQSGYTFDGFYIVNIEENKSGPSSSIVNSKRFTQNCYVPQAKFFSDYIVHEDDPEYKKFMEDAKVTTIDDYVVWDISSLPTDDEKYLGKSPHAVYDFNGIKGYAPLELFYKNKVIVGAWYKNKSLKRSIGFVEEANTSARSKYTIRANGEVVPIRINGLNGATFSLTIKDSSGCSILEKQIKNYVIPESGEFILNQEFPALLKDVENEIYDLVIIPSADTQWFIDKNQMRGNIRRKIYQFKEPTLTFNTSTCAGCGTHSVSSVGAAADETTVTYKGEAFEKRYITTPMKLTTTITRTGGSGYYYTTKQPNFHDNTVYRSDIIKKRVDNIVSEGRIKATTGFTIYDSPTSAGDETPGFTRAYSGDIKAGMFMTADIEETKTIMKSIPIDTLPDDDCVKCKDNQVLRTDKFEVDNTYSLFEGMSVSTGSFDSQILSIDCDKRIRLTNEVIVTPGQSVTFSSTQFSRVVAVKQNGTYIKFSDSLTLPHKTELTFNESKKSHISGMVKVTGRGTDTMVITSTINDMTLGQEDVTFTLDLDNFVTMKPPARDKYITIGKNTTLNTIALINENNGNTANMTATITREPSSGTTANISHKSEGGTLNGYKSYTPKTNFTGLDKINFTISDGVTTSDEKTIFITVK